MRPVLKSAAWERVDSGLRVVYDLRDQFVIDDPDGSVEALLGLLAQGGRTAPELAAVLGVPVEDVVAAIGLFDEYGLVEDGDPLRTLPAQVQERHFSNLAFFESFSSLSGGRTELCRALWDAHVLVLGTGGLNSNVVPHLAGDRGDRARGQRVPLHKAPGRKYGVHVALPRTRRYVCY